MEHLVELSAAWRKSGMPGYFNSSLLVDENRGESDWIGHSFKKRTLSVEQPLATCGRMLRLTTARREVARLLNGVGTYIRRRVYDCGGGKEENSFILLRSFELCTRKATRGGRSSLLSSKK